MRFCPKCSLKIKGTVPQCPICKVELLSCADDEETDTLSPEHEKQSAANGSSIRHAQPLTERGASPFPPSPTPAVEPADVPPPAVSTEPVSMPAQPEKLLESLDHKLNIHIAKEEVITRSLVELESRLINLHKDLQELKKASALLNNRLEKIENTEHRRPGPDTMTRTDAVQQKPQPLRAGAVRTSMPDSFADDASSSDFPPADLMLTEEETHFSPAPPDDFGPSSEKDALPTGAPSSPPAAKGKKPFYTFAVVFILLAVCIALTFYYKTLQDPTAPRRTITEEVTISSQPDPALQPLPEETAPKLLEGKPEPSAAPAPPQDPLPPAATIEEVSPATPVHQEPPQPEGRFTVSVGAFKDKSNAIALTSKLTNKGYPASSAQIPPKNLFRVSVGTFQTREDALAMSRILSKKEKLPTEVVTTTLP